MLMSHSLSARKHKCTFTHISQVYDYTIIHNDVLNADGVLEMLDAEVLITSKKDKKIIQRINYNYAKGGGPRSSFTFNCLSRSFITGFNKNAPNVDGDWGDIIVADFNFDGKEDFAIRKSASPMDAPIEPVDFYIQNDKGQFIKDSYLSSEFDVFPDKIDARNHTISVEYFIGANPEPAIVVFKYNATTQKWKEIKQ